MATLAVPPDACQSQDAPRLVVLIAVDQLRPDYFTRYQDQLTGGLRRFWDRGAFYTRGEQDHAVTETAPGHATMLTGRSPASVGIVANLLGVQDTLAPLLMVAGPGASPHRFRGTTLYDWMRAADGETQALSISRKDRGAILTIGRAKVPVYWYWNGILTTSRYYADTLPTWLREWNDRKGAIRLAGQTWDLLLPADKYAEPDSQPWENAGRQFVFPYQLRPDSFVVNQVWNLPWGDSLTFDAALEGVRRLGMGRRNRPDLLSVSLSNTDAVGHTWGPDSREIQDQILRLDRWLGWFMDSLAVLVPSDRTIYVLTSDHGVTSYPEYAREHGRVAGRVLGDSVAARAELALQQRFGGGGGRRFGLQFDNGLLYGDTTALRSAGVNVDSLASALASQLARHTGVTRIYTPRILAQASEGDVDAMRWRRTIPADFPWLAAASVAPGYIWSFLPGFTTHGTTNASDVLVPIAFLGPGIPPGRHERARTVDIAPTLAAIIGVKPAEAVEGVVLKEVVGSR